MRANMFAASILIGLAACSPPDRATDDIQADNGFTEAGLNATGNASPKSSSDATSVTTAPAESEPAASGMPIVNHPEVNEHVVHNDEASAEH